MLNPTLAFVACAFIQGPASNDGFNLRYLKTGPHIPYRTRHVHHIIRSLWLVMRRAAGRQKYACTVYVGVMPFFCLRPCSVGLYAESAVNELAATCVWDAAERTRATKVTTTAYCINPKYLIYSTFLTLSCAEKYCADREHHNSAWHVDTWVR